MQPKKMLVARNVDNLTEAPAGASARARLHATGATHTCTHAYKRKPRSKRKHTHTHFIAKSHGKHHTITSQRVVVIVISRSNSLPCRQPLLLRCCFCWPADFSRATLFKASCVCVCILYVCGLRRHGKAYSRVCVFFVVVVVVVVVGGVRSSIIVVCERCLRVYL